MAVDTRDEREWSYVYAENMAEVKPGDPDSGLTSRMDEREAAGQFDCDTFVIHVLETAGYDLDAVIVVEGQETTVRRFIMLHAETILRDEYQIPEGAQESPLSTRQKQGELYDLLQEDDARMGGVMTALTLSGQGTQVTDKDDLRPGDLLQYWFSSGSERARGHAVVVHTVKTRAHGTLNEASPPQAQDLDVTGVGLLSAHTQVAGTDVFTKRPLDPDRAFLKWFAVRPSGSRWPLGSQP